MGKKKFIWIILIILGSLLVSFVVIIGTITVKGYGISIGRYLEAKDGQVLIIIDNSPVEMSNRTEDDLFEDFSTGDKILIVNDGIAESYPGKTGIYAAFKMKNGSEDDITQSVKDQLTELGWLEDNSNDDIVPGGMPVEDVLDVTVSYANWSKEEDFYYGGLNKDVMLMEGGRHYPIYRFDTLEELEQFKDKYDEILTMNHGYDEIQSFNEVTAKYDGEFFEDNSLMLAYVGTSSGSLRFDVDGVYCDGKSFRMDIKQVNDPEVCTEDMAGWFLTVAVSDDMINDCEHFDAD